MATKAKEVREEVINIDELTIDKAFRLAQMEFGPVIKNKTANEGKFSIAYATLDQCMDIVLGPLHKYGLSLRQLSEPSTDGVIVETIVTNDKGVIRSSGKFYISLAGLQQKGARASGSAQTYARRYSLITFFGLCPVDDDGQAASYSEPIPLSKELWDEAVEAAEGGRADLEKFWTKRSESEIKQLQPYVSELRKIREAADERLTQEKNNGIG